MSTTSQTVGTRVFEGIELLTKTRYEVFSFTGTKPRFEIRVNGKVEQIIRATRAWQKEQREAIQWCQQELGWVIDDGKANTAQARVAGAPPVSDRRIARMALLYAAILSDRGYLEEPERLLELGRAHAETWAAIGGKAFTEEMNRLRAERNEQETRWTTEAKAKVTYY